MLVYKCPKCGVTYSKKEVPHNEMCSSCDTYLKVVNIKTETDQVENKPQTANIGRVPSVGRINLEENKKIDMPPNINSRYSEEPKQVEDLFIEKNEVKFEYSQDTDDRLIEGTVISASNDAGYRRHPWEKLYDRYLYSQNVSNNQNSIYVRCIDKDGSVINRRIVMYGQIKGGIDIIRTGMRIKGEGKYNRHNEFVAKQLIIEDSINVSIRTELSDVLYYASPLLVAFLLFVLFNFAGITQGIMQGILNSSYLKWILIGIVGLFMLSFYIIGRIVRLPIYNRIRASAWISVLLGIVLFFVFKALFIP